MTTTELERFSFEIYNSSGSGKLNKKELHDVLVKIHGKKHVEAKLASILELMDLDHSFGIDIEEYLGHIKQFPVLMFPVFSIQDTMRQYILGESFWRGKEESAIKYKATPVVKKMLDRSFSHKHLHNIAPIKGHRLGATPENSGTRAKAGGKSPSNSLSRNKDGDGSIYRKAPVEEKQAEYRPRKKSVTPADGMAVSPATSPRRNSVTTDTSEGQGSSLPRKKSLTPAGTSPRRNSNSLPSDVACAPRKQSLAVDTNSNSHPHHHHQVGTPSHTHHHHDTTATPKNIHAHAGPQIIKYGH
jgi:hypothetical protein